METLAVSNTEEPMTTTPKEARWWVARNGGNGGYILSRLKLHDVRKMTPFGEQAWPGSGFIKDAYFVTAPMLRWLRQIVQENTMKSGFPNWLERSKRPLCYHIHERDWADWSSLRLKPGDGPVQVTLELKVRRVT